MKIISLNGKWLADHLSDLPYLQSTEPAVFGNSDTSVQISVPGYWEDMSEVFAASGLDKRLKINPLYEIQSYPQYGYCDDMALPNPVGCLAYKRCFELDFIPDNCELYFGGVQNALSLWINGEYIGRHEGYSTPFSFPIPSGILKLGKNRITLAISNNRLSGYNGKPVSGLTSRAANECTGGIYGDVELRLYAGGLRDLWVTTSSDLTSFTIHTDGAVDTEKTLTVELCGEPVGSYIIPRRQTSVTVSTEGYKLWSPSSPALYHARVSASGVSLERRFGIRRLSTKGGRLLLNGEPYYFCGTCEHCYHPVTVHPTLNKEYYLGVIMRLKELGFNSIRFHTYIPPYAYMEAADELGMLFEVETPNNTSEDEWRNVVSFCRRYACVNIYSTGNELQIDNDREKYLEYCAGLVHTETDALFSPMSAMRGVEYMLTKSDYKEDTPFEHNPQRLERLSRFCDLYNTYSLGATSYDSTEGRREIIDERNSVYDKPLLTHEICIHGTYIDLSLEQRYENTRIGNTAFMSSVREHLADKGLLDKSDLYYRHSSLWQASQRKHCFETVRLSDSFAGYDFLGDIDTHWHTFGYCVGMMNEFYELKHGETVENVLKYNGETVLLADLPRYVNYSCGDGLHLPVIVSNYGKAMDRANVKVNVICNDQAVMKIDTDVYGIESGKNTELCTVDYIIPELDTPCVIRIEAELSAEDKTYRNEWELYAFPVTDAPDERRLSEKGIFVTEGCSREELISRLQNGESVVILGTNPFPSSAVSYQISVAGRTNGHLATVIEDHPVLKNFPHRGFCDRQFEAMMNGSRAAITDLNDIPHEPVIDIATSYKNARKEAMLFEYRVGNGRLIVCTFNMKEDDPASVWLKNRIISYALSGEFSPRQALTIDQLEKMCGKVKETDKEDSNRAMNKNDITM